jgi:hypothetical protein
MTKQETILSNKMVEGSSSSSHITVVLVWTHKDTVSHKLWFLVVNQRQNHRHKGPSDLIVLHLLLLEIVVDLSFSLSRSRWRRASNPFKASLAEGTKDSPDHSKAVPSCNELRVHQANTW